METTGAEYRRTQAALGCVAALLLVWIFIQPKFQFGLWVSPQQNTQVAEAQAWWNGTLQLTERYWDTALVDGRVYNVFPPMFTLIAAGWHGVYDGVPQPFLVLAIFVPIVVLAYVICYLRTRSIGWAILLCVGLVLGTSAMQVLSKMLRGPTPYVVNHSLALLGVLLICFDIFGARRIWVACIGLLIAAWSRQLTGLYLLPLLVIAWREPKGRARRQAVSTVVATGIVAAAIPMTLNALKFGSPFDSGYSYIFNDRPADVLSEDAKAHGLFSGYYVPRNLYYSCLGFPKLHEIEMDGKWQYYLRPNFWGTGIWWTTPVLLFLLVDFRRLWGDPVSRWLLVSVVGIFAVLLFYHSSGYSQRGINRFSLDYLPVVYLLLAPRLLEGRRKWMTMGMIVWSVIYFVALLPERNLRIW